MTFVELAQEIDKATKEVDDAKEVLTKLDAQCFAAATALKSKKDNKDKLMAEMRTMLGLANTTINDDTVALKQLALDGAKLRNR